MPRPPSGDFLRLPSWPERRYVAEALRQETLGGALLVLATVAALVWANSPLSSSYVDVRDLTLGPEALHLDLTVGEWAGEGLLAIFFFVAGLELKRELVLGSLRRPAEAVLPVAAALTGMAVPAAIYLAITHGTDAAQGWAIPTATDIAFCLAVLAVVGRRLPTALRAFLLTLAVVDDLVAILIIAVAYSGGVEPIYLLGSAVAIAGYGLAQRRRIDDWYVLLPLAVAAWAMMHAAGVHPTVAGVSVGLLTRARRDAARDGDGDTDGEADPSADDRPSPVERFEHFWRPVSAGVAVPLFALFSVGIALSADAVSAAASDPAAVAVVVARVVGKTVGVFGGAYLVARLTAARLSPDLVWADVFAVAALTGIGFAVPLLVSDVAFGAGSPQDDRVTAAILAAALVAAIVGAAFLRLRHRHYDRLFAEESRDDDHDGVPDVYQRHSRGQTAPDDPPSSPSSQMEGSP